MCRLSLADQPAGGVITAFRLQCHVHAAGPHAGCGSNGWSLSRQPIQPVGLSRRRGELHGRPGQQPGGSQVGSEEAAGKDASGDTSTQTTRPAPPLPAICRQQRVHLHGGPGGGGAECTGQPGSVSTSCSITLHTHLPCRNKKNGVKSNRNKIYQWE